MKSKKLFFMECHLAGRQYHDADLVWDELKIGTPLRLERDTDNRFDPNAVAVIYDQTSTKQDKKADEDEEYLLGYIPAKDNEVIAKFLEMGWDDCFSCTISKLDPEDHYENQIRLTIRINKNKR